MGECQEHITEKLAEMNEVHEQLGLAAEKVADKSSQLHDLKAEELQESARRGQLRAEMASSKRDAKARDALLTLQLRNAFDLYQERAMAVISTLPHMKDREEGFAAANAQLMSIGAAMLDDCRSASGWQQASCEVFQ